MESVFVAREPKAYNSACSENKSRILGDPSGKHIKGIETVLFDRATVRPRVADLIFHVYGRALHPELFRVCRSQTVRRGDYEARIDITSAGHVVQWRHGGITLTEVAAAEGQPLPDTRRLLARRLRGERAGSLEHRNAVVYHFNFQLEPVDPEVFWTFQEELARQGLHDGLFYQFPASNRLSLGALSYINVETRDRSMMVQSFHTFPDDFAVVKVESLIEVK